MDENGEKYYRGLPITSMAIVLPLTFMVQFFIPNFAFRILLHFVLLIVGLLFIVDFKMKKPKNSTLAILVAVVAAAVLIIFLFTKYPIHIRFGRRII